MWALATLLTLAHRDIMLGYLYKLLSVSRNEMQCSNVEQNIFFYAIKRKSEFFYEGMLQHNNNGTDINLIEGE